MTEQFSVCRTLVLFVNGTKIEDPSVDPEWTLLFYLRKKLRLCGTKLGCGEGGCGACTVMISKYICHLEKVEHYTVNACLTPIASMHGLAVTTVEGIGSTKTGLHAVQDRIGKAHGSQCGFCTPGMVMSMYTLLRNNPIPSMAQIDEYFTGNLCRCTGYRPIIDGVRSFSSDGQKTAAGGCGRKDCCQLNGRKSVNGVSNGVSNGVVSSGGSYSNGKYDERHSRESSEDVSAYEETDISHALHDETEFKPYDPSQEIIFPPELKVHPEWQLQELEFVGPRVRFYRPSSLARLLQLKALHPDARLIVGNTEVGVEVKFKNQHYPVLINPTNVTDMTSITVEESGVTFGASVTLTSMEDVLKDQVKVQPEHKTRVFSAILEMLRWFAGKQIRNVAALGGNIMTGSPISDLNPLLMAAGATLTLCSKDKGERQVVLDQNFFISYRQNIAMPDEILLCVHIPYTQKEEYFFGYKQSRRRDDDIAIVNAGMKVIFQSESCVVQRLDLAFGGMAPTTIMALKTMKELVGRKWDHSLFEAGTTHILKDLPLSPSAPGGMTEYRQALTVSMFFKFYLNVRGLLSEKFPKDVKPLTREEQNAIQLEHYHVPKSTQIFQKVPSGQSTLDPIGRPIVHTSALKQTTGEAVYVDDIPHFENELYAGFIFSDRAHAQILSINESEALAMDGVERFFCARDIPNERNVLGIGLDEEVFASEKVTCAGQLVAMVVAKDKSTAQRAAKRVKIQYKDIKPRIITVQDAICENSFYDHWTIRQGDVESSLKTSTHVLEGEMHVGGQEHFYLETNAHVAVPKTEDDEIEIYSSNQNPSGVQNSVAKVLGIPINRVVCHVKRIGGGFGGKCTRSNNVAVPLCVAASQLGRPVRIMLDRDEDMVMTGTRNPMLCRWKVGFSEDGILSALDADIYANGGHSIDSTGSVIKRALLSLDNVYKWADVRMTGYACKTNLPSNTAFRGFGAPQSVLFMEDIISRVSAFLKLDPNSIRERNMYRTDDMTPYNMVLERCTIRRCWDEVIEQAEYRARRTSVEHFNKVNKYKKRGLSAVPLKFGIGYTTPFHNQAGALVNIYTDGSVLLTHGGTEMGQGLHTKMIQVASKVLGISADKIYIGETATDKVPNTSPTAASSGSDLNGMAVKDACEKIRHRLESIIAQNPKGSWEDWVKMAYFNRISLSATGFTENLDHYYFDFEKGEGTPYFYFTFGAAVTEVEIDCLTGSHSVIRTDIVMDVGESLNPAIDIGQIEGAFMQGLGLVTMEELCYSPEGVLLTRGPGTYKIPSFQDIPREFNVSLLRGAPNPRAVFSSKGVGEPPLLLAGSVLFSIKDAISAARDDLGLSPVFRLDSPATVDKIRMACQDFITQKIESPKPGSFKPWSVKV